MSTPKKARTRKKPPLPEPFGFACDAFEMRQAIATVKPAVARRGGSLPILSGLKFAAADGTVTLSASDLELSISTPLRAAMVHDGAAVLPTTTTESFVKTATKTKTSRVTVAADGEEDVSLSFGPRTRKIRTFPSDEWPRATDVPDPTGTIDAALFAEVLSAASSDDCRPILTGVCIDDGQIVATDSYRLYLTDGPSHADIGWTRDEPPLIPRTAVSVVAKLGGSPSIAFTAREVAFAWPDGTTVMSRLIEGGFPNYRGLVPADLPNRCTFDRAELIDALRSMATLGKSEAPVHIAQSAAAVTLSIHVQDIATESVTMTRGGYVGTDGSVAFNPAYLLDAVRSMSGETIELRTTDEQKPAVLAEDRILGGQRSRLLMPVRVR